MVFFGEYISDGITKDTNVVKAIEAQEEGIVKTDLINFKIRQIAIKSAQDCSILLNGRKFTLENGEVLETGWNDIIVTSLTGINTTPIKLVVRYKYEPKV